VAWGTPASLAAHRATDTIPIVMSAGDPVGAGIVTGLARPGRNVTGMSVQMAEQEGKRLELLKKLLPSFRASPSCLTRLTLIATSRSGRHGAEQRR
jgi:putative ABC transport system substrate-binding protein